MFTHSNKFILELIIENLMTRRMQNFCGSIYVPCWMSLDNENDQKYEERPENVRQVKLHKQVPPRQATNCYGRKTEATNSDCKRENPAIFIHTL